MNQTVHPEAPPTLYLTFKEMLEMVAGLGLSPGIPAPTVRGWADYAEATA